MVIKSKTPEQERISKKFERRFPDAGTEMRYVKKSNKHLFFKI
jgi:hypothetical protein